jgi:pre-mRNA-processing factor SLU7
LQDPQQAEFAGDNFIRYTGDVKQFSESQLYEITAQEIGSDIHMNALPTLTAKV